MASKQGMAVVPLRIDGKVVWGQEGDALLHTARRAGIYIPTLCSQFPLHSHGTCRMCLVQVEGADGYLTACNAPTQEGMVVYTATPEIEALRQNILASVISETQHPCTCLTCHRREKCRPTMVCLRFSEVRDFHKCLFCPKNQRCELQRAAHVAKLRHPSPPVQYLNLPILTNPTYERDYNLCIVCGRCVRVCEEVRGRQALTFVYRDGRPGVDTPWGVPMETTDCEFCGACVDLCPTGALMEKQGKKTIGLSEVTTICPYCGVGCQLKLQVKEGRIIRVVPDAEGPANRGQACVKGKFGIIDFVHHPERLSRPLTRLTGPLMRQGVELRPVSWEEALDAVAQGLKRYQPSEVAVFGAGKCTNEDNYVMQKLCRAVLKSNNIDHCARLCHAPTVSGLVQSLGSGAMTNTNQDIGQAACILAIGTNTRSSHPVIGLEIIRSVRQGGKLIVANPREIELCRYADIWLRQRPGSDVALVMGMVRAIVEEGLADGEFIQERCENYEAMVASLKEFTPQFVEETTGVAWEEVARAAKMYAQTRPASILYAMGITQSSHGTDNVLALSNLALVTGNIGKPGAGINPLRGHNNVQGACDMGALPEYLPGYQRVDNPEQRARFERAWGVTLPSEPGLTLTEIIHDAYQGHIKALYLMGENISLSEPCVRVCQGALEELEFLVVQDIFLTETAQLAHVVLPACSFAEREGTFTNTERRVQRVRQAIPPVGDSRPDWWIICQVAKRLGGKGFDYEHPSQVMEEVASLTPIYGGISYERLEAGGLQWPCPHPAHPGTPILHTEGFPRGRGKLFPLSYKPPAELPDEEYPLMLTTERSLFHFHTGTLTRKVKGLNELRGEELVELNPRDAQSLGVADGDRVRVSSRRGEVEARAKVTAVSPPGVVSMTFHFSETPTNILTNPAVDPVSKIPEIKVCAVRVERVA